MPNVFSRAAPFAGQTDAPSGLTGVASPLNAAELVRIVSAAATALLVGAAAFVTWRRVTGAIAAPLPAAEMLLAGALVAALGWTAHPSRTPCRASARRMFVSPAVVALGIALSRVDGNWAALIGFWAIIVGEELWAWRDVLPNGIVSARKRPTSVPLSVHRASPITLPESQEPLEPAADVLQQLTLRTNTAGDRELSGWLRMSLAVGQRSGALHVAFCPPFDRAPEVHAEAVAGPDCRIKTAEALPYGVRLEVKLNAPAAEEASVLLWFFAANVAAKE
jgi:hypothetical protein